ncbi:DUF5518 domain-containing protein [Halorussus amylolyticus]|uniref:DUF5518 domain-containing protein n=1 Tax=Halorussus amylolyticus TaxID=1126242 RepID=UPI00192F93EB|nr:DUF5518 domain-containing protein [Halorussus amylolyticus]
MKNRANIRSSVTEKWRYSVPGGILAAVFVALSYSDDGSTVSLGAVFFVGILVGVLSKRHYGTSKGTGVLTGLVGAVPVVWMLGQMLTDVSGLSGPAWFTATATIMTLFVVAFGFALSAVVGEVGARIGGAITGTGPTPDAN